MLDFIKYVIFGVLFGAANAIPGVSGGTIAVILNFYDRLMDAISLNFKKLKKNLPFLIPLAIGIVIGIILVAKLMGICLEKFPTQTYFAFIGVVIGSIPLILYNAKKTGPIKPTSWIPFVIFFGVMIFFAFFTGSASGGIKYSSMSVEAFFVVFFSMVLGTTAMIIPGVSGSLVLTMIGMYETIFVGIVGSLSISNIKSIFSGEVKFFDNPLSLLIPAGLGAIVGFLGGAKGISYMLKKHPQATYMAILGLLVGSIVQLFMNSNIIHATSAVTVITSIVIMIAMMFVVYLFSKDEMKRDALKKEGE